jgi:hypothetical protein
MFRRNVKATELVRGPVIASQRQEWIRSGGSRRSRCRRRRNRCGPSQSRRAAVGQVRGRPHLALPFRLLGGGSGSLRLLFCRIPTCAFFPDRSDLLFGDDDEYGVARLRRILYLWSIPM